MSNDTFYSDVYGEVDIREFLQEIGRLMFMITKASVVLGHTTPLSTARDYLRDIPTESPATRLAIEFIQDFLRMKGDGTDRIQKKWHNGNITRSQSPSSPPSP